MAVFDFCPTSTIPERVAPEDGGKGNLVTFNSWVFSAKPTVPYVPAFRLILTGLRWYLQPSGLFDKTTDPTHNAARLEDFLIEHQLWKAFDWTHPHLGGAQYRFRSWFEVPRAEPNSNGRIGPVELFIIQHNPGYT